MCSHILDRLYPSFEEAGRELDHEIIGIIEAYKEAWKEEDNRQSTANGGDQTEGYRPWTITTSKSSYYPVGQLLVEIRNEAIQDCILYHRTKRGAYQIVELADPDDSDVDPDIYEKEMAVIFRESGVDLLG